MIQLPQQQEDEEETYTRIPEEDMKLQRDVMRVGGEHVLLFKYSTNLQEQQAKEEKLIEELMVKPTIPAGVKKLNQKL